MSYVFTPRCARCGRETPLGSGWIATEPDPEDLDRLLCKWCWSALVLNPGLRTRSLPPAREEASAS